MHPNCLIVDAIRWKGHYFWGESSGYWYHFMDIKGQEALCALLLAGCYLFDPPWILAHRNVAGSTNMVIEVFLVFVYYVKEFTFQVLETAHCYSKSSSGVSVLCCIYSFMVFHFNAIDTMHRVEFLILFNYFFMDVGVFIAFYSFISLYYSFFLSFFPSLSVGGERWCLIVPKLSFYHVFCWSLLYM